jgi:isocitrate dehydrogenase (NAD+)
MMLRHLGLPNFADNLANALNKTIVEGKVRTRDIGG